MTYLATPRVVCCGRFLSDVSTRNNVPGNFDSGIAQITDLWNNLGGATFELLDCRVTGGSALGDQDPATGYILTDAADRPSAKMVDLDPAWQMASEIWALALRLIDPQTQELAFCRGFRGRVIP
jgi:hypothetical protein